MLKKLISVFVVTTMLLCMLTASVGYGRDLTSSEAEKFLSVLGIVSSDNIDTNVEISREEFSFILAKAIILQKYRECQEIVLKNKNLVISNEANTFLTVKLPS